MSFTFTQPTGGGGFLKPAELDGHLILITQCHKIEDRYDNFKNKEIPAATIDFVDLDDPEQELREGVLATHAGVVTRLHPGATLVLGRIGKATTKSGFEAWVLAPYDEAGQDALRAQAWMEKASRISAPKAPAPQAAPAAPAPAPVQQQAPAAPAAPAPAATPMADPSDPAVQALLASLQQK